MPVRYTCPYCGDSHWTVRRCVLSDGAPFEFETLDPPCISTTAALEKRIIELEHTVHKAHRRGQI